MACLGRPRQRGGRRVDFSAISPLGAIQHCFEPSAQPTPLSRPWLRSSLMSTRRQRPNQGRQRSTSGCWQSSFRQFRTRQIVDVTRADIERLHHGLRNTPYQANRVLAVLSRMFALAEGWGLRHDGSNPCRHVQKYRERRRDRFLSAEELARLGIALTAAGKDGEPPAAIAAIRLLALTGCRKSEVLRLRWSQVEPNCLRLSDSKTGAKVVPLGAAARELLASLPSWEGNPYVIVGDRPNSHFIGIQKVWERIRRQAGLDDVRIHDLRHSFASVGASSGDSLLVIGALLGHRDHGTTQRYAHLSDDPLQAAADRISAHIATALERGQLLETDKSTGT